MTSVKEGLGHMNCKQSGLGKNVFVPRSRIKFSTIFDVCIYKKAKVSSNCPNFPPDIEISSLEPIISTVSSIVMDTVFPFSSMFFLFFFFFVRKQFKMMYIERRENGNCFGKV